MQAWIIVSASLRSPSLGTHRENFNQGGRGRETFPDVTLISNLSCRAFIFHHLYKQLILSSHHCSLWLPQKPVFKFLIPAILGALHEEELYLTNLCILNAYQTERAQILVKRTV